MSQVQHMLIDLHGRGWTIPAIADELGLSASTIEKWKSGARHPSGQKMVVAALEELLGRKRLPRRRRYIPRKAA